MYSGVLRLVRIDKRDGEERWGVGVGCDEWGYVMGGAEERGGVSGKSEL